LCHTPDLRTPWIEDIIKDVEDCFAAAKLGFSRITASRIRKFRPADVDLWVQGFWIKNRDGKPLPAFNEDDFAPFEVQEASVMDVLGMTKIVIPPEVGNAAQIFEQLVDLNVNIKRFLHALAAITLEPDDRGIDRILNDDELISALRKRGVFKVCDLIHAVVTGHIYQMQIASSGIEKASGVVAYQVNLKFEAIREAISSQTSQEFVQPD